MKTYLVVVAAVFLFSGCYSKQDEADAFKAADKIHSQLKSADFSAVYKQASQGLRKVMDESTFVSGMTQLHKENGGIRTITPVAYQSRVDSTAGRTHTLLYDLEFERARVRERMVFTRSSSGQMELWDLVVDRIP